MDNVKKSDTGSEISIQEFILMLNDWIRYLLKKYVWIILFILLALTAGYVYYRQQERQYEAISNFVLEGTNNQASMGSLGSVLGIGANPSTGLFTSADNIIWLYTSEEMLKTTLLMPVTEAPFNGELLINMFIRTSVELDKRLEKVPIYRGLYFEPSDTVAMPDEKIKFLRMCIGLIKVENLKVSKVEKTDNIVSVNVISDDEEFSYYFNKFLVDNVNKFYTYSKTKKQLENVETLQSKSDSLKETIDKSMYQVATTIDQNPFPNPHLTVLNVEPQKKTVDVQLLTNMYVQTSQSLELAKSELAKETPIIQLVDQPVLPLPTKGAKLIVYLLVSGMLGLIIPVLFFIIRRIYLDAVKSVKISS